MSDMLVITPGCLGHSQYERWGDDGQEIIDVTKTADILGSIATQQQLEEIWSLIAGTDPQDSQDVNVALEIEHAYLEKRKQDLSLRLAEQTEIA